MKNSPNWFAIGLSIFCIAVIIFAWWSIKNKFTKIMPGDYVYCQMKDEVVGDYWLGRVMYVSEDAIWVKGGHVPMFPDDLYIYGVHQPYNDWLILNHVDCGKIDLHI